jgi:hypothetical protein
MKNEEMVSSEELLAFIEKCEQRDIEFMRRMFLELFYELTRLDLEKAS